MFLRIKITDRITVLAEKLQVDQQSIVKQKILERYLNKITESEGLCIGILSFRIIHSVVQNDTGDVVCNVQIVAQYFSSFQGELLKGNIKSQDSEGIVMSLHGIDVFIPKMSLLKNSHWDENDSIWKWSYDSITPGTYSNNRIKYFYTNGDEALFKTSEVNFSRKDLVTSNLSESESKSIQLFGSMVQDGLGPISWWN